MKKMTLVMMISVAACFCFIGCSHKMHPNLMDKSTASAPAPAAKPANDASLVPFTKLKRQQLERNNINLTQVQFYIDQKITLRRMGGNDREVVKGGTIVSENTHFANEIVIPAFTPVVCDRVNEDSLMISFESPNNDIPFGALYGSNTYSVLGTNWINGSADVTYDNQTYRIICSSCENVAEVKLLIKETNIDKPTNANKTVVGRKLYK